MIHLKHTVPAIEIAWPWGRLPRVLAFWFLAGTMATVLVAEGGVGAVTGKLTDAASGAPLPGVVVTATELSTSGSTTPPHQQTTVTDATGLYRLIVPSGEYEVRFELHGFHAIERRVTVGTDPVFMNVPMQVLMSVTVSESSFSDDWIEKLPLGRDFSSVVSSAPVHGFSSRGYRRDFNTESYDPIEENRFVDPYENPLSTFATDVDTASFANVRRLLKEGSWPPRDAVRLEEFLNYYTDAYGYPEPEGSHPFSVSVDEITAPWKPEHQLVRIGLRGKSVDRSERPNVNLVFLLDVSGSMTAENKLPWVVESLRLLVNQLKPRDRVAIVVYAGAAGVVLEPTLVSEKETILKALERLEAGGSTNGGEGIELAYRLARDVFDSEVINRVILATDGDWNVGITSRGELIRKVEEEAEKKISLTVLGFGMGNYKDDLLEDLSKAGDGSYAYIDTLKEARKVLVEQVEGTLVTIAKEVKIQVEFNPARVASHRLLGYENRLMPDEDFDDDDKDGGEIGAGHTVTALYEIVPRELVPTSSSGSRNLRYQLPAGLRGAAGNDELLTVKLRYQLPEGESSFLMEKVVPSEQNSELTSSLRLATGLAATAMLLRDSPHLGDASWNMVESLFAGIESDCESALSRSLLKLVARARELAPDELPLSSR